jgi:hypothetical protein
MVGTIDELANGFGKKVVSVTVQVQEQIIDAAQE